MKFFSPEDEAEIAEMELRIMNERIEAEKNGSGWTPFRPFISGWERLGAMRCCSPGRHGGNRSTVVVSYGPIGRVALCQYHYDRRNGPIKRRRKKVPA